MKAFQANQLQQKNKAMENKEQQSPDAPKGVNLSLEKSFVGIGNAILPLLSQKREDREKQASFVNYLLTDFRNRMTSPTNRKNVTHADVWNWNDLKDK